MATSSVLAQAANTRSWQRPAAEPARPGPASNWSMVLCGLGLAGLAATARRRDGWLGRLDGAVVTTVANHRSATAVRAAGAVSALAEPGPAIVSLAAAAAVAARRSGWRAAIGPCIAVLAGTTVRRGLSHAIARQRPPAVLWLAEPEGFSLPSKHTCLAALTAGACASALGADRAAGHAATLLAATGVGASRICLGVHWPTDVLAGWLFAAGWLDLTGLLPTRPALRGSQPPAAASLEQASRRT